MRAPYNVFFDSYFGPTSPWGVPGNPNAIHAAGRLVPITQVVLQTWYDAFATAYLTTDFDALGPPNASLVAPGLAQSDFYAADQVAIPSGGPPTHFVADTYEILGSDGAIYYRYVLIPLPYPF